MKIASRRRTRRMVRVAGSIRSQHRARRKSAWTLPSLWTQRTRPQGLGKPHRTRFPTAPTRIIALEGKSRTQEFNHAPHTKILTLPATTRFTASGKSKDGHERRRKRSRARTGRRCVDSQGRLILRQAQDERDLISPAALQPCSPAALQPCSPPALQPSSPAALQPSSLPAFQPFFRFPAAPSAPARGRARR